MKRFLVFAGDESYPSGGWKDFKGSFDTDVEYLQHLVGMRFDWCHVIEATTGATVFESKKS